MTKGNRVAFGTLMVTIIGASWWQGARTATKEDVARVRREIQQEIRQLRNSTDARMQELRGYIINHLDGHAAQ